VDEAVNVTEVPTGAVEGGTADALAVVQTVDAVVVSV
jgi:hypothetical protein